MSHFKSTEQFLSMAEKHGLPITNDGEEYLYPASVRDSLIITTTIDGAMKLTYKDMAKLGYTFKDGTPCCICMTDSDSGSVYIVESSWIDNAYGCPVSDVPLVTKDLDKALKEAKETFRRIFRCVAPDEPIDTNDEVIVEYTAYHDDNHDDDNIIGFVSVSKKDIE